MDKWQALKNDLAKEASAILESSGEVVEVELSGESDLSVIWKAKATELTLALLGLWWDAKGDWKRAHESAQQDEGPEGSLVHAYLHRKEGDQGNSAYWYGRAVCREPLDAEWVSIVRELLGNKSHW